MYQFFELHFTGLLSVLELAFALVQIIECLVDVDERGDLVLFRLLILVDSFRCLPFIQN